MPSTFSPLKIQLMSTGENNTTWGDVTNLNLGTAIEEAIVGSADVTFASANVTLTLTDTNASQTARNMRLRCTGTTGGSTRNLVVPSIEKPYIVKNDCADSIVVKTAAGTGITVPAGKTMWVYSDATNVVDATTHLSSLTLASPLPVSSGGTGVNTSLTAGSVVFAGASGAYSQDNANFFWDDTNNRLGIGTSAPTTRFQVIGGVAIQGATFPTSGVGMELVWDGAQSVIQSYNRNASTYQPVRLEGSVVYLSTGGTERMRVTATGNVGIGTSSPTDKLSVSGNIDIGVTNKIYNGFSQDTAAIAFPSNTTRIDGYSGITFHSSTTNTGSQTERMRITNTGEVAIGSAAVAAKLNVVQSLSGTSGSAGIWLSDNATTSMLMNNTSAGVSAIWGSSSLAFGSGSNNFVERMRIDGAGNVGVGTSSPGARLDVTSGTALSMRITGPSNVYQDITDGTGTLRMQLLSNAPYLTSIGAYPFVLATNNTERMRVTATGNVGIGTTTPSSKLQVSDSGGYGIEFSPLSAGFANIQAYDRTGSAFVPLSLTASYITFQTNGTTERMRINTAGDVGIGTISPGYKLQVSGTAGFANNGNENLFLLDTALTSRSSLQVSGTTTYFNGNIDSASHVQFVWRSSSAYTERMRIDNSGNVGIGTASPGSRLTVSGTSDATQRIAIDGTNTYSRLLLRYNSSDVAFINTYQNTELNIGTSVSAFVNFYTNNTERMRITAAGNVGIGTTAPSTRLGVIGDGRFTNTANTALNVGGGTGQAQVIVEGPSGTTNLGILHNGSGAYITQSGGTSGFLFRNTVGDYTFSTGAGNTERVRITEAGNVGIGTASPADLLHVAGNIRASGATPVIAVWNAAGSDRYGYMFGQSGSLTLAAEGASRPMLFSVNGSERMRIDSSGNVGIGTSSPSAFLDVVRTTVVDAPAARFSANAGGGSVKSLSGLSVYFNLSGGFAETTLAYGNTTNSGLTIGQHNGTSYAERMRIDNSGNVGIGTASPRVVTNYTNIGINGTSGSFIDFFTGGTRYGTILGTSGSLDVGTPTAIPITFSTNATERMRIDSAGNVGIGTSAPGGGANDRQLTLSGSSTAQATFITGGTANSIGANSSIGYVGTTSNTPFVFVTNNTERVRIDTSGNLLVGCTSTAFAGGASTGLYLTNSTGNNGGLHIKNLSNNTAANAVTFYGWDGSQTGSIQTYVNVTAYNTSSDYRLKNIDGPIANSGAYIDALNPVQGSWKADGSRFIGLLAHEVQEVSETPIATGEKDGEEMQAMDYSAPELIANLIAEIQSLRARVAQLEGN